MESTKNVNTIKDLIDSKFSLIEGVKMKYTREFYDKIGTNQKEWALILNGKKVPNIFQITKIAEEFHLDKQKIEEICMELMSKQYEKRKIL